MRLPSCTARVRTSSWTAAGLAFALTWFGGLGCDDDEHDDEDGAWSDAGAGPVAIEHVTVLPMTGDDEEVIDATVLVASGRIEAIGPTGEVELPSGVGRVDGRGKWLMPALADSHVHVENDRMMRLLLGDPDLPEGSVDDGDIFTPYVAHGVLQIANMGAMSEAIAQRADARSGQLLAPQMVLAAMIDGSPPIWPEGMRRVAATPEDGRQAVRDARAEGYDQIKVYEMLTLETFTAIVEEAQRADMVVVGHIPGRDAGMTEAFFQPGFAMVAHAEEFFFQAGDAAEDDISRFTDMMVQNGTWLTSTLTLDERILEQTRDPESLTRRAEIEIVHPTARRFWVEQNPYIPRASPERIAELERLVAFNRALVEAFIAAGIQVVPGTDTLVPGVVPGVALHDELEALVAAGMTNDEVLQAATRLAATWMGTADDRGTVEPGKRADLLLLDGDPRQDIAATREIAAVLVGGRLLERDDLDQMLADLSARYADAAPATENARR
jgi:imidazolonepropionase-like amidohydrolase